MRHKHRQPLILFLIANEGFVKSHRLHLLQHLVSLGFRVGIAMSPGSSYEEFKAMGIDIYPLKTLTRNNLNPLKEIQTIWEIKKLYQRLRPTIVHHVGVKLIFEGTVAAALGKIQNVVNGFSGMGYLFLDRPAQSFVKKTLVTLYRFLVIKTIQWLEVPQSHKHICQNMDDQELLGNLFKSPVIRIEGNGINLTPSPKTSFQQNTPFKILALGRLLYSKGLGELIIAVRNLQRRHTVIAVLAGALDPQNPDAISETTLQEWISDGIVEWRSPTPTTDVSQILQEVDVMCLPSYREGMSRSLQEACGAGLPIVTTDVPGCRDIGEGGAALLVPPYDAESLEKALESLINDSTLRETLGKRARQAAEERFSSSLIFRQFDILHRELAEENSLSAQK